MFGKWQRPVDKNLLRINSHICIETDYLSSKEQGARVRVSS